MPFVDLEKPARPKLPLHLEMIPQSAWYVNVRTQFSSEHWNLIRKYVYQEADYECEICGGRGKKWPVECHEQWAWDEATLTQQLVGFLALCPNCHAVKHIGYSQATLSKTALDRLYRHQRVVNGWKKKKQAVHFEAARMKQERRNALVWTVDTTYAKQLLVQLLK